MNVIIDAEALMRLKSEQSLLKYNKIRKTIVGNLQISMYYDIEKKEGFRWNISEYQHSQYSIIDSYDINIDFSETLPTVKETWNRIKSFWENMWFVSLDDLHIDKNNTCCLMPFNQLYLHLFKDKSLKWLFEQALYPYFYSQSYFEKYKQRPMWEFLHWALWILQFFNQQSDNQKNIILNSTLKSIKSTKLYNTINQKSQLKPHHFCFCGSWKKIRYCHNIDSKEYKIVKYFINYIKFISKAI